MAKRGLLVTGSALALGAALAMAPGAALAECTVTGNVVACTGTVDTVVVLENGQILENDAFINEGVTAADFKIGTTANILNNRATFAASMLVTPGALPGETFDLGYALNQIGLQLGAGSILNNESTGLVSGSMVLDFVISGYDTDNRAEFDMLAVGVFADGVTTINNAGRITALASVSMALDDVSNYSNLGGAGSFSRPFVAEAHGIASPPDDPVFNGGLISAEAYVSVTLIDTAAITLAGPSAAANGIYGGANLLVLNSGSITATARANFSVTDGDDIAILGRESNYTPSTAWAAGIQTYYGANILNQPGGLIGADARINVTIVDSSEVAFVQRGTYDGTFSTPYPPASGPYNNIGRYGDTLTSTAIGVYVGPVVLPWHPSLVPGPPFYYFATDDKGLAGTNVAADTITNFGTVNAYAGNTFTITNSDAVRLYASATAAGIMAFYPAAGDLYLTTSEGEGSYSGLYGGPDHIGFVRGTLTLLNAGTIDAIAATTLTVNLIGGGDYDGNVIGVYSASIGIAAGAGNRLLLGSDTLGIGAFDSPRAGGATIAITNTGAINAIASTGATITVLGQSRIDGLVLYFGADSAGVLANGYYYRNPEVAGPIEIVGAVVTNTGAILAGATTVVTDNIGGNSEVLFDYVDLYTDVHGIGTTRAGTIVNTGTVAAQGVTALTLNVTASSDASSSGSAIGVGAYATGINLGFFYLPYLYNEGGPIHIQGTVTNTGTVTATALASLTVSADASSTFGGGIYGSAYATGIDADGGLSGALGAFTSAVSITNTGKVDVLASVSVTMSGDAESAALLDASAIGIAASTSYFGESESIIRSQVLNSGAITVNALIAFTATAGPQGAVAHLGGGEAYAFGILADDYANVSNTGTIAVHAGVGYTLQGAPGDTTFEGFVLVSAYGLTTGGNTVVTNDGRIVASAVATIALPSGIGFDGEVEVTAIGLRATRSDNVVVNNGSIAVAASLVVNAAYTPQDGAGAFNHTFGYKWARVTAYGLQSGWAASGPNSIVNTGTIVAGASITVNGTVLTGNADPAAAFGIWVGEGTSLINRGLVATTRVAPHHWAVYLNNSAASSLYNYGQTIGSHFVGELNHGYNYGTMTFRLLPPADGATVAAYGTYDRIVVKDAATFDTGTGQIVVAPQGNTGVYANTTTYRYFIDTSATGSVVGLTTGSNVNLVSTSAFLVPTLVAPTDPDSSPASNTGFDLVLTRVAFDKPLGTELVGNQANAGIGLESGLADALAAPGNAFAQMLGKIQALPPGAPPRAYQQLAGELGANIAAIGYSNAGQLLGLLFGRLGSLQGGFLSASSNTLQSAQPLTQLASASSSVDFAQAPPGAPNSRSMFANSDLVFWMSGYGQTGTVDGAPGISGTRQNVAGGMVGVEKRFSETLKLGLTVGGGSSWTSLRDVDAKAKGSFFQGALYGSWAVGSWYLDGAAGYAHHRVNTERTVQFPGFGDRLEGDASAHQFIGGLETGFNIDLGPAFRVTPFAGVQATIFRQGGYSETGGGAALRYNAETTTSVRGLIGAQFRATFTLGETMRLDPYVRAAWAHEFGDRSSTVAASFVGAPASGFAIKGAARSRDAALIGGGFELTTGPMLSLFAAYSGELAPSNSSHAGTIGLRLRW